MGTDADRIAEVREVADRLEIIELMTRWHRTTDAGRWEEFRSLLADDFEWVWVGTDSGGTVHDTVAGADEFVEWDKRAMTGSDVRHITCGQIFESLQANDARTSCYMHVIDAGTLATIAIGLIIADHVRTPAGWRIRRIQLDEQIMEGGVEWMRQLLPERLK